MERHGNNRGEKSAGIVAAAMGFFQRGWEVIRSLPLTIIILLFTIVVGIVAAALVYYRYQEAWNIREHQSELSSIADLKVGQIVRWRLEREGDGLIIAHNSAFAVQAKAFFDDERSAGEILQWVKIMCTHNDYSGAGLYDSTGRLRLSYGMFGKKVGKEDHDLIEESLTKKEVVLSDLHLEEDSGQPAADLVVPLLMGDSAGGRPVGSYLFHIDPRAYLFPLVRSWPSESRTSESLLIRREGDEVVYLNELRHLQGPAMQLRKPASAKELTAALAVNGAEGAVSGIDYRGVNVIAAVKKVPGTSWYFIAKVDRDEVDEILRQQGLMDSLVGVLFILATLAIAGFWWRHQRVRFFRSQLSAEQERRALVQHFEYLVRFANDIIILADKDLKIVEANNKAMEVYGYLREELIGSNLATLEAAERADQFSEQLRFLNLFLGATYESMHQKKDGTTFPVEVSARVITIEGTVYYQTISRDITERKRAEAELREREYWIQESQRVGHIGSYAFDFRKDSWTSSGVLDSIFGIGPNDDRTINGWLNIVHPDEREEMLRYFTNDVIRAAKPFDKEYRIVRRNDGAVRWVWGRGELSFDTSGVLTAMVGTIQDITDRKEAEAEIRSLNAELERRVRDRTSELESANRELEAFSYSVSHDLRAPLRGIDGWSLALAEDYGPALDAKANEYVVRIRNEAQRMGALIDDLLQLSKVTRADISLTRLNISALVRTVAARLQEFHRTRSIEFSIEDGLLVDGDAHLLEIAMTNLLDNACKFTGHRSEAKVEFGKRDMDGRRVYYVKDNGVGFDMAYAQKMFGAFQRMHKNSEFPGTGVGLATVQRIIRRHRGEIWAEAAVGNGATFFFTLQEPA